jgi:hypothetical protein
MRWIERVLCNFLWMLARVLEIDLADHLRVDERRRYGAPAPKPLPPPYC